MGGIWHSCTRHLAALPSVRPLAPRLLQAARCKAAFKTGEAGSTSNAAPDPCPYPPPPCLAALKSNQTALKIQHLCLPCPWSSRAQTIGDMVLCYAGAHGRTIIFTETKKEANELALDEGIKVECAVLHGDIAQAQRETTFQAFRDGKFRCLGRCLLLACLLRRSLLLAFLFRCTRAYSSSALRARVCARRTS